MRDTQVQCPKCGKQGTFGSFTLDSKGEPANLLGKDREGYIHVRCPGCSGDIRFDSLKMKFVDEAGSGINFFGIVSFIVFAIIVFLLFG